MLQKSSARKFCAFFILNHHIMIGNRSSYDKFRLGTYFIHILAGGLRPPAPPQIKKSLRSTIMMVYNGKYILFNENKCNSGRWSSRVVGALPFNAGPCTPGPTQMRPSRAQHKWDPPGPNTNETHDRSNIIFAETYNLVKNWICHNLNDFLSFYDDPIWKMHRISCGYFL